MGTGRVRAMRMSSVTPAKAGVQSFPVAKSLSRNEGRWIPACAGMTILGAGQVYFHGQ